MSKSLSLLGLIFVFYPITLFLNIMIHMLYGITNSVIFSVTFINIVCVIIITISIVAIILIFISIAPICKAGEGIVLIVPIIIFAALVLFFVSMIITRYLAIFLLYLINF